MAKRRRVYSSAERKELWERWTRGESVSDIARAIDRAPGTIHCTIRERGGVVHPSDAAQPNCRKAPVPIDQDSVGEYLRSGMAR
jgi:transposase-like protein